MQLQLNVRCPPQAGRPSATHMSIAGSPTDEHLAPRRRPVWLGVSLAAGSAANIVPMVGASVSGDAVLVGTLGVLMATYVIALCAVKGLLGEPLLLTTDRRPDDTELAASLALLCGVATALVSTPLLLSMLPAAWTAVATVACAMPVVLLQDVLRYVAFTRGAASDAAFSDVAWALVTLLSTVVTVWLGLASAAVLVGGWMLGGVAGCLYLVWRLRPSFPHRGLRAFLTRDRALRLHLTSDALLTTGSLQASLLLAVPLIGLAGAGVFRFLQLIFGPVTLLFGVLYVEVVSRNRLDASGPSPVRAATVMAAMVAVVTAIMAAAVWSVPVGTAYALGGDVLARSQSYLGVFALGQIASSSGAAAATGLRLAGHSGRAASIRVVWACGLMVAGLAGGAWGVVGYIVACVIVHLACAGLWWQQLLLVEGRRA